MQLSLAGTNGGGNAGFPAGGNSYAAMMTAPVLSNSMNMNPNHIFGDVGAMGGGGSSSFGNSGPSSAGAMSSGMNFGMGMGGAIDSNHFRAMPMGSGSNGGFDSMGFPVQQQQQQQPFQQLQQQQQQPAPMSYAPQHNPQPLQNQQQNMMSMGAHGLGNGSGYAPNLSPSINPLPSTPQLNGNAAAVGMSQMSLAGAATMMPNQSNQPFGQMQQQHQHGQQQQQLQPQYQSQQQQQPYSGMMAAPQSNWGGGAAMSPSIGGYGMQQPNFPGGQQGPMPGGQFQGMSQMQQQQPYGVQQSMGGQMMPMGMQQHQPMQMQAMPQPQAPVRLNRLSTFMFLAPLVYFIMPFILFSLAPE